MPHKPRKQCGHVGCPTLVESGIRYCPEHKKQYNRRAKASHYDRRWRKISKLYLSRNPLCVECEKVGRLTPATETHHKTPVTEGGSDRDENLMALCKPCHSRFTLVENLGR